MSLRSWDDALLPRCAAAVQRFAHRLSVRADRVAGPGTPAGDAVRAEPALAGSILAVTVAAVVLAAAGGPGDPGDHDTAPASPTPAVTAPVPSLVTTLGPTPGTSVADYLRHAAADLRKFTAGAQGRAGYAVVDLSRYVSPAQAAATFAGVDIVRAYVRVPPPRGLPTQVHAIPLENNFGALADGMRASGRLAAATANTFKVLVAQLQAQNAAEKKLRERYAAQEQAASFEATRLQQPDACTCVFAVVVHARARDMTRLAALPTVRVVDPASAQVTLDELTVFPLGPEITTKVPRGGLFGA